eukprot:TRINITY_DN35957_c0_g1_i1.p1 TRINITY_DN35957_c0_g1~~TRINITY_DN35957_c0_g1_i1.p1  ORF type:complete len:259 (-),score=60.28 TRINITY_DN35957_c0_g1_i1:45-821(-)
MMSFLSFFLLVQATATKVRVHENTTRHSQRLSYFNAQQPQCECVANDASWKKTTRTEPKCIFIDLGAADGNTFAKFVEDQYGPVKNCPSGGKWEAYLVEANPEFRPQLNALQDNFPGQVHSFADHAAFSCEAETSFYIDTDATMNHWGSSLDSSSPDALKSGQVKVTVPMMNVVKLIAENVRPDDWVMLKVDIEGAEYSVLPCLAQFAEANLVDRMYLEEHWWFSSVTDVMKKALADSKVTLMSHNVDIPNGYWTPTL